MGDDFRRKMAKQQRETDKKVEELTKQLAKLVDKSNRDALKAINNGLATSNESIGDAADKKASPARTWRDYFRWSRK